MKDFKINIAGLGEKVHEFHYRIDKAFFEHFGKELVSDGDLEVHLMLDKQSTFLTADFRVKGIVCLICDRSLEPFDHPLNLNARILFKYADQAADVSDEIIHITRDTVTLDMGPVLYDLIGSSLPMKRLHPRFAQEQENETTGIIYSTGDESPESQENDPRWEKLRQLKEKQNKR